MSSESFGDISLADYRRIAGVRRGLPRWSLVVMAIATCALCTAAGDYSGLWSGKNTKDLKFAEAIYLLEHPSALEFQVQGGMLAADVEIERVLKRLEDFAKADDANGRQARGYLLNLAIRTTKLIEDASTSEKDRSKLERYLPRRSKTAGEDGAKDPK